RSSLHSTPFPYTTLFRSVDLHQHDDLLARVEKGDDRLKSDARTGDRLRTARAELRGGRTRPWPEPEHLGVRRFAGRQRPRVEARDRKSTRLNSSHQIISY